MSVSSTVSSPSASTIPEVSIVMPAYDAERYAAEAVRSIIAQTFTDWELIVIDDGSVDETSSVIGALNDDRISIIRHDVNRGLSTSYNEGIRAAQGAFIARMDADDIMLPERLEKQVAFLKAHPDIGVVGSAIAMIDEEGHAIGSAQRPTTHARIAWTALFSTPLYHPTIMARSEVLKEHPYNEALARSEDYELWSRLLFTTPVKLANLPEELLRHRIHGTSATRGNAERGRHSARNSIANIRRYVPLDERQEEAILAGKHALPMRLRHVGILWRLIGKTADAFIAREKPSANDAQWIHQRIRRMRMDLLRTYAKSILGLWKR